MKNPQPKTQPTRQDQGGQSLVTIIMLGALLAFFGITLTRMLLNESKQVVETKKRDKLFTAGDAALQRSLGVLLQSDANWNNPQTLPGFSSLNGVAFADIPGLTYYVKVLPGTLQDQGGFGAADDAAVLQWVNVGSQLHDRTIFVRAIDQTTKQEDRFFTVVHRTPPPPYRYGDDAIAAAGTINIGDKWSGKVFNSCAPGTTYNSNGVPSPLLSNSEGGLTMSTPGTGGGQVGSGGNWEGFGYNTGPPPAYPALVVPTTVAVPGHTKTSTISTSIVLSNPNDGTLINFECARINFGGGDTITVNGPGKVALWVTGSSGETVGMGGNNDVVINKNGSTECCQPKLFTIYVTKEDTSTNSFGISWNGTPKGYFMIVGPKANMEYKGGGNNGFKGAIAVQNLFTPPSSNTTLYYDACLKNQAAVDQYSRPPLVTTEWQQIGHK